jgi:uncharacterized protein (DUF1778 family)
MTKSLRCAILIFRSTVVTIADGKKSQRETLNLRIRPEVRGLIDRAAKLTGKNRTDFVLDAARQAAESAILDRTVLTFSAKAYADFVARLDAPPRPNKQLLRSLQTKAPWE